MNGVDLAKLHVAKGTRPIIDDIDELRIVFGFDVIEVLTPIVESRLRGGLYTLRPLSLNCNLKDRNVNVTLTFQSGFPKVPLEVKIAYNTATENGENREDTVTQLANASENEVYIRAVPLVKQIRDLFPVVEVIETSSSALNETINATDELDTSLDQLELNSEETDQTDTPKQPTDEGYENAIYTCRMCRALLFTHDELHSHSKTNYTSFACTSFYLTEPPAHLALSTTNGVIIEGESQGSFQAVSGKLICKCSARVGE